MRGMATIALAISLVGITAPAHADPVPEELKLVPYHTRVDGSMGKLSSLMVFVVQGPARTYPTAGTAWTFRFYDCHGVLAGEQSHIESGDKAGAFLALGGYKNNVVDLDEQLTWTATITYPGYDPYQLSGVANPGGTCEDDGGTTPSDGPVVKKWSVKKAGYKKPRVGKRGAVTPTRASKGSSISYTWKVGKKTVKSGRGRQLKIKKSYRGKRVLLTVKVSKNGESKQRTINFRRARR